VVVHGLGFLVENEGIIDETTFAKPTGDAGRVIMAILLSYRLFIR
jgi:hypothetical protein